MIRDAPAEVGQPGGIALDPELDRQLVAEVADGVFVEQDGVDQAAVAASGTAAEAFHAEVRGRGAQGKVGHHVGNVPQHPHGIFLGVPALRHNGLQAMD